MPAAYKIKLVFIKEGENMKKNLLMLITLISLCSLKAFAQEENMVQIEIPASNIETIDVKYEKEDSTTTKAIDATKDATKKTVEGTKNITQKTVDGTKKLTKKTVKATKNLTEKTYSKDYYLEQYKMLSKEDMAVLFLGKVNTKKVIDNLNPNKPITFEKLQSESDIKIIKVEKKQKKAAYNSRIKDINAQIKATEQSTILSETQKQNKIYKLNKEKAALIYQRDKEINNYNLRIERIKENNK